MNATDQALAVSSPPRWRVRPREVGFFVASLLFVFQGLVGYGLVVLGWLPQAPTDDLSFALVALAYHGPFFAFWDAPGEQRTPVERYRTFVHWWILTAATAVLCWELPWILLESHILRLDVAMDRFHDGMEHLWIFWGYGIADHRFLNGDVTVLSIESCSIATGLVLVPTYLQMRKDRPWAYALGGLGMMGVAYVTVVYVISAGFEGWVQISDRPFDFWVKFLLTQTPYIFYGGLASVLSLVVAHELAVEARVSERPD